VLSHKGQFLFKVRRIAAYFILTLDSFSTCVEWEKLLPTYISFWEKTPELPSFCSGDDLKFAELSVLNTLHV